jgi:hypothetical protein
MALLKRGWLVGTITTLVVAALALGAVLYLGGRAGIGPLADPGHDGNNGHGGGTILPKVCPLTGLKPSGDAVPNRPALAVKVENLPAARPQTGLSWADIIYEEPVEAGITRFIVVYQCQNASRIEPVRSARFTDVDVLTQLSHPVFGFAGGVPSVLSRIHGAQLVDVNFDRYPKIYHRDPARQQPHNLYTSTQALYAAARSKSGPPVPLFVYSTHAPRGKTVSAMHIPFSTYTDLTWKWVPGKHGYERYDTGQPQVLSDGTPITTKNVVVQMVMVTLTGVTDVNGVHSPEAVVVGSGKVYILRGGKMISGTWRRPGLGDKTVFTDGSGHRIALAPGTTWIELVPNTISIQPS